MNSIYYMLLFIGYLGVLVDCQGGGGGGAGGGFGGGGYHGSGLSCTTDACERNTGITVGSIFGGIFGLIALVISILCCCKYCKGRPSRKNSIYVNAAITKESKQNAYYSNMFQSGIWSSQYYQYGSWHGPHHFSLTFDPQTMKVTGAGSDDVGTFTIDGTYSDNTHRIGLTKTYQAGTGNLRENLGHHVIIQLTWNEQTNQFEGKWYVQTNKYHGENKFKLKFHGQQQTFTAENA